MCECVIVHYCPLQTRSSTRTSVDEQMEISDARRVAKEVIEKREMRRQGSLQVCTEWTSIIHPHVEISPSL